MRRTRPGAAPARAYRGTGRLDRLLDAVDGAAEEGLLARAAELTGPLT